jgi:hypothetical protein
MDNFGIVFKKYKLRTLFAIIIYVKVSYVNS